DLESLESALCSCPPQAGKLIVVEGVYSMTGDLAPLDRIVALAKTHGARILLDDAHGMGVLGGGHGTATHFGLSNEIDLISGTFSKSFASIGGFVAGSREVIHFLRFNARPLIFSAGLPSGNTATVLTCLS